MSVSFEVVEDPAHACAAMMVGAASGGGDIVLAGRLDAEGGLRALRRGRSSRSVSTLDGTTLWVGDERCVDPDRRALQLQDDQGEPARSARRSPGPAGDPPDARRARSRGGRGGLCPPAGGVKPTGVRAAAARNRAGRAHVVAVPGAGDGRRAREARRRGPGSRSRPVRAAHLDDVRRGRARQDGGAPRLGRVQGRGDRQVLRARG